MSINFSCATIFCDDIRHEINGKMSLMGMYGDVMYLPDFPITIPKICAFFELRIPPDLKNGTDATLTIMKGPEKIGAISLPIQSFDDSTKIPHGKPYVFSRSSGAMEFSSIIFTEPTLLELVVQIDGQSVVGGRLWVTRFPQGDEASATAAESN